MFAILGINKHKDRGSLIKRASHHLRVHEVANADPSRLALNGSSWKGAPDALVDDIWKRTDPAMQRKDGVRVVELMLTASPEWFQEGQKNRLNELATGAREFISEMFGKENIVALGMHRDEKSPHIWAFVTPIFEGKLRASRWLDGPKKMEKLHTDWAAKMAPFGLVRGAKKSGANHIDIRTYYTAVNGDKDAQEGISREMARRASRAQKRAEVAEKLAIEIEVREAKSKQIFDSLTEIQQETAAKRFAEHQAALPLIDIKETPYGLQRPTARPSSTMQKHLRPS